MSHRQSAYHEVMRIGFIIAVVAAALSTHLAHSTDTPNAPAGQNAVSRTSGVLNINGTPHPYLVEGTGPACIVVGPASMYPSLLSDQLKKRIRFVYVDFKNSWGADSPNRVENVTLDSLVEEVDRVRSGLGLEKVCLFGHSAPGLVAVEYTLRHPDRVSQLILVSVEPYVSPGWLKARKAFWETEAPADRKAALKRNIERFPDDLLKRLSPYDAFALSYVRNGPRYFYDASYDFYWEFAGKHLSAEMIDYFLNTIVADYDPRPRLESNDVPKFLALGRYDYNIPYREWDSARKTTPNLTSHIFERSGHFPMIEESTLFDDRLIEWLRRTSKEAPEQFPSESKKP